MHGLLLTFTLLVTLFFATSAQAFEGKIYRWTDKNGKIHFSDTPPQDESLKVEEQKLDSKSMTVTSMPRSQKVTLVSEKMCQSAIDNLKNTEPLYRGELVKKLAQKQITNEQFSEGLAKLDDLKEMTNPTNCRKANPDEQVLLNCIAQNKDARSCIK
ncbi:MAG: DUF4124 domain-containing protein [Kangiella sp.]|jgi:hypothetical protein|nr:DUF4124 domain-containing protein [Kangiella sp.]MCW9027567.1 DUF4124 domain-containing protein [Kangiella sp.]